VLNKGVLAGEKTWLAWAGSGCMSGIDLLSSIHTFKGTVYFDGVILEIRMREYTTSFFNFPDDRISDWTLQRPAIRQDIPKETKDKLCRKHLGLPQQ